MKVFTPTLAAFSLLAAAHSVHAENLSLRIGFDEYGLRLNAKSAELGSFALTPSAPTHAEGDKWRLIAKDDKGQIVYETVVRSGTRLQAESFDPQTGKIEMAKIIAREKGVVEVALPFEKNVASVEVVQGTVSRQPQAKSFALNNQVLATFSRADLEKLLTSSSQLRRNALRSLSGKAGFTPSATTVLQTGNPNLRMDYVFVGDGYTAAEMDKWHADAAKVIEGFLADPLFAANRNNLNIYRVDVASNESGVDEPDRGIFRDTAFDAAFNCYNIERLLCVDDEKVFNTVGTVLPPGSRDVVIVVANSTRYGGSGGSVGTLSMHRQATEIALHEIGHTAFGLADEYDYGTCDTGSEPGAGNVSLVGDRSVKWGHLIAPNTGLPTAPGNYPNGTVGTFVGAQYCAAGKYRPTENSRMRTLGYPWHAVNEELARNVFVQYTKGTLGTGKMQSGTIAAGDSAYLPAADPGYVQAGAGTITVHMVGPKNANFDLFLFKWNGNGWQQVAASTGAGATETLRYAAGNGYYYAEVRAVQGSGAYQAMYSFPPR